MYILATDFRENFKVFIGCCAAAASTTLLIGIACGCFLINYKDWFVKYDHALPVEDVILGWAFWMAVVVCLLLLTAIGMLVPDTYVNSREEAKPKKDPRLPYNL